MFFIVNPKCLWLYKIGVKDCGKKCLIYIKYNNNTSDGNLVKTASTPRPSWKGLNKARLLNC